MKRKIIQLAKTTYVVSLPLKWVKSHGVKKKEEVEVTEEGSKISISLSDVKEPQLMKASIDVRGMGRRIAEWSIAAVYKRGFDEIKVYYEAGQLRFILDYVKDMLLGFFVTEQAEDYCILKSVSKESGAEFDNLLRRSFLVGLELAESSLALSKKGKNEAVGDLLHLEKTNNQLTLTCQRFVRKGLVKENANELFLIAWHLENVVDDYRDLCKFIISNPKLKLRNGLLEIYSEVNAFFRGYYAVFYKFDLKQLNELDQKGSEIMKIINALGKKEDISFYLASITRKLSVFSATMMSINNSGESPGLPS